MILTGTVVSSNQSYNVKIALVIIAGFEAKNNDHS